MVPHHGTNWAALRLTSQIGRDAVLSESYGRGYWYSSPPPKYPSPAHTRSADHHGSEDRERCKLSLAARKVTGPSSEGLP